MKCEINDSIIHYEIIGSGPPLLMIHGYGLDHRIMKGCMEPVFSRRKENRARIYFDLPGMGKTGTVPSIQNADDMLNFILEFINRIIPDQDFAVAGESYGGYLARGIINKMAARISGLLLICPVIIPDQKKRKLPPFMVVEQDNQLLSELSEDDRCGFESMSVIQNRKTWKRFNEEIIPAMEISDSNFLEKFQATGYSFSFSVDEIPAPFEKPALFLTGKQDHITGYMDTVGILNNYPRGSCAILDSAGHGLQIEKEHLFNELISEWLDRIS